MRYHYLILAGLMLLASLGKSQVTISSVTFSANPTDCDSTYVTLGGQHYCANYIYNGSTTTVSGSNVTVNVYYLVGFICLPAIVNYSKTVNMGLLPSGTLNVTVNTYLNGSTSNTSSNNSLTVTGCCPADPSFTASADSICEGQTINFTNTSTGTSSTEWYLDGNQYSNATNTSITFDSAGTYVVSLVGTNGSCNDTFKLEIFVNPYPLVELGNDTSICQGTTATFSLTQGQGTYLWSTGSSGTSETLSNIGSLSVTVTDSIGCAASDTVDVISILLAPSPNLGPDVLKCPDESITVSTTTTFGNYQWSTGASTPSIQVTNDGWYWVDVSSSSGCWGRDSIFISEHTLTSFDVMHDSNLCGKTRLFTTSAFDGYLWSNAQSTDTATVFSSGTYTVTVNDANGCEQIDSLFVELLEVPPVNLGNDTHICDESIILQSGASGNHLWSNGLASPVLTVTNAGTYSVTVTNSEGCSASDTIIVGWCLGLDEISSIVSIYPNPTNDLIYLNAANGAQITLIQLFDSGGRIVMRPQLSDRNTIDIGTLPTGIYILSFNLEGRQEHVRILKN